MAQQQQSRQKISNYADRQVEKQWNDLPSCHVFMRPIYKDAFSFIAQNKGKIKPFYRHS